MKFLAPQLISTSDAPEAKGQELLKYLEDRLEAQSPAVAMRRTLDAAERAQRSANKTGPERARPACEAIRVRDGANYTEQIIRAPRLWFQANGVGRKPPRRAS